MRLCRFDNDRLGLVEHDELRDVTAALDVLPRHTYPLPRFDPLIANLPAVRARIESIAAAAPRGWGKRPQSAPPAALSTPAAPSTRSR